MLRDVVLSVVKVLLLLLTVEGTTIAPNAEHSGANTRRAQAAERS
jgi:hypothetical protein